MTSKILIVGGGAGGLELATRLARKMGRRRWGRPAQAEITLIDRNPTHIWKPLLHEVATGALDSGLDEVSYSSHAKQHGYQFRRGEMVGLDRERRCVTLAAVTDSEGQTLLPERELAYDQLVLALGSVSNDFGTPGVKDECYFLDSPAQAEAFRKAMLNTFLQHGQGNRPLSIAIVGGGATGVELSAELFNASRMLHSYGVTSLTDAQMHLHLIEAAPRILSMLPERISQAAHQELTRLGVDVHTATRVTEATSTGLKTETEGEIKADLKVWAAGIKAPSLMAQLDGLEVNRQGQLKVRDTLQSEGDPHIFAIGDCAACPQPDDQWVPPRAQAAHQMADTLYVNLRRLHQGKMLKPFRYRDRGSLVSLSHFDAVGSLMRNQSTRSLVVEGTLARLFYISLYRLHQKAIHGWLRTGLLMLVDSLNRFLKPKMKLH